MFAITRKGALKKMPLDHFMKGAFQWWQILQPEVEDHHISWWEKLQKLFDPCPCACFPGFHLPESSGERERPCVLPEHGMKGHVITVDI